MQNLATLSGTYIKEYEAMPASNTVFNFGQHDNQFIFPTYRLQNLGTTTFGDMLLHSGANVATPGATPKQAGQVYQAFTTGNLHAVNDGRMGMWDAAGGDFVAANGLFNAGEGIMHSLLIL